MKWLVSNVLYIHLSILELEHPAPAFYAPPSDNFLGYICFEKFAESLSFFASQIYEIYASIY